MQDYEKLGAFYLGKVYDLPSKTRLDEALLYDSKDLVTHAVCVGMTGSGKTGLCLGLIEEAAIDGIPSLIIDPKGDLSNLLLTFPDLAAADFAPWINEDDARKKGVTPADFAQQQADLWRRGLAEWGQEPARIRRFKDAADVTIYTPGSAAGVQVSVLKSFDRPAQVILNDPELLREHTAATAAGLLAFLNADTSPQSRELTLLSNIFANAWNQGQSLDLPALISAIQTPGFSKLGVMELESIFPAKDRFALAMQLNNLVAAPGFSAWMEGVPIDIQSMLYGPSGKPRIAIFSIAHLNDGERMFFVSRLLNQMLAWTRAQTGTTSLRALLYMDEIAGYFPPVANPPSKQPLLTLMKQARAFGVGCLLATQNPVDIDYKGLSNAGTWFIGRLQTQRDKDRVLDGLEGAAAGTSFDRATADRALSSLGARIFLMNNVHEDGPVVFETRWCLSYLRGPLSRQQTKLLMDGKRPAPALTPTPMATTSQESPPTGSTRDNVSNKPPVLPPSVAQYFLPTRQTTPITYHPRLLGIASIYYADAKLGVQSTHNVNYLATFAGGVITLDWEHAAPTDYTQEDLDPAPASVGSDNHAFADVPPELSAGKHFDLWKKQLADALFRRECLQLLRSPTLDELSLPNEKENAFRTRLAQRAREMRDAASEKLRLKYAPKLAALEERIRKANQTIAVQQEQSAAAKTSTFMSVGTAILGAFLGRKIMSAGNVSKAASAARGFNRQSKESSDVARAQESAAALLEQRELLETQFQADVDAATSRFDPTTEELETLAIKPKKSNITIKALVLAWEPS